MPTHFPGALGDMDALYALARRHGLRVIEDAALVQGSAMAGPPIGSFGDIATFSFHPNKNMTTIEGGAVVVPDQDGAKRIEVLRFHGIERLADDTRDVRRPAASTICRTCPQPSAWRNCAAAGLPGPAAGLADHYFRHVPAIDGAVLPPRGVEGQSWNMFCVLLPFDRLGMRRQAFRAACANGAS